MATIGNYPAHVQRQKRAVHVAHRKAFGPTRARTPEQRAQDVAASIAQRNDEGRAWTWETYGLEGNWAQQRRVEAALAKLTWTVEEEARLQAWYWEQEQTRLDELARVGEGL